MLVWLAAAAALAALGVDWWLTLLIFAVAFLSWPSPGSRDAKAPLVSRGRPRLRIALLLVVLGYGVLLVVRALLRM